MGQYKLADFAVGDSVYHLSNTSLIMVVIEVHSNINELSCRWIDKKGIVQCLGFMPEELGKSKDLGPHIYSF